MQLVPGRIVASPFDGEACFVEQVNWQHYTHILGSVSILGCGLLHNKNIPTPLVCNFVKQCVHQPDIEGGAGEIPAIFWEIHMPVQKPRIFVCH